MRIIKTILNQDMRSNAFNFAGRDADYTKIRDAFDNDVYMLAVSADESTFVIGIAPGRSVGVDATADYELAFLLCECGVSDAQLAKLGLPEIEGTQPLAEFNAVLDAAAVSNGSTHSVYYNDADGNDWHTVFCDVASLDLRVSWDCMRRELTVDYYTSDCAEQGPYVWEADTVTFGFESGMFERDTNELRRIVESYDAVRHGVLDGKPIPCNEVARCNGEKHLVTGRDPITVDTFHAEMGW